MKNIFRIKKFKIMLLSLFVISSVSFGEEGDGDFEATNTITITAEIFRPLILEVIQHVNFGTIIVGQTKNNADMPGKVKLTGEPTKAVKIYAKANSESAFTEIDNKQYDVILRKGTGGRPTTEMTAKLKININGGDYNSMRILPTNGVREINLDGSLTALPNQESGKYQGDITLRVEYEELGK